MSEEKSKFGTWMGNIITCVIIFCIVSAWINTEVIKLRLETIQTNQTWIESKLDALIESSANTLRMEFEFNAKEKEEDKKTEEKEAGISI